MKAAVALKGEPRTHIVRREMQILEMLTFGHGNRSIAEELGISEETVKRHLSNACDALGLDNRTQLALWYVRKHGEVQKLSSLVAEQQLEIAELKRRLASAEAA